MSCLLICHEAKKDALSNSAYHLIQFLLPLVLHFPLPFVGIGFSQDQITWLQQNGISLSVIVSLLSLSLSSELLLPFLEGFSQSLM